MKDDVDRKMQKKPNQKTETAINFV